MTHRYAKGLFKTLWILRDYLPEIVVGGGWRHSFTTGTSLRIPIGSQRMIWVGKESEDGKRKGLRFVA